MTRTPTLALRSLFVLLSLAAVASAQDITPKNTRPNEHDLPAARPSILGTIVLEDDKHNPLTQGEHPTSAEPSPLPQPGGWYLFTSSQTGKPLPQEFDRALDELDKLLQARIESLNRRVGVPILNKVPGERLFKKTGTTVESEEQKELEQLRQRLQEFRALVDGTQIARDPAANQHPSMAILNKLPYISRLFINDSAVKEALQKMSQDKLSALDTLAVRPQELPAIRPVSGDNTDRDAIDCPQPLHSSANRIERIGVDFNSNPPKRIHVIEIPLSDGKSSRKDIEIDIDFQPLDNLRLVTHGDDQQFERQIDTLQEAANRLNAVGLHDQAHALRMNAEEMKRQHAARAAQHHGHPHEPMLDEMHRALRNLNEQVEQLRRQVEELRGEKKQKKK